MNYCEAPESVKYWRGYDPSDPPQDGVWCPDCERWEEDCRCPDEDLGEGETAGEDVVCAASSAPSLLLRYPVWDMTFSEYGDFNGWEVPS